MARMSNMEVDFIDEHTDNKEMSEAEKEHAILDIIHKLFVISSFHNHKKHMNDMEAKKKTPKRKIKMGGLSNGSSE